MAEVRLRTALESDDSAANPAPAASRAGPRVAADGLVVVALGPVAKLRVQARGPRHSRVVPPGMPMRANAVDGDDPWCLWRAPGEWLVYGARAGGAALREWVHARSGDARPWLTDVSSASVVLELRGPRVAEVLLRDCTLDLEGGAVAAGDCAHTTFAQVDATLHRLPDGTTWRLFVERSVARHAWDWLADTVALLPRTPA